MKHSASEKPSSCDINCDHCDAPGANGDRCCWATAMEINRFRKRVKKKYIIEVIFDMIISTASVSTDIIALILYFYKGKLPFALLTAIPVLLPTFVFTNVYLADNSQKKPVSRVVSVISGQSKSKRNSVSSSDDQITSEKDTIEHHDEFVGSMEHASGTFDSGSTNGSIQSLEKAEDATQCKQECFFHWSCIRIPLSIWSSCCSGCAQCLCNRDHELRRRGALAVKNSLQRLFKYGFGTFVLRFIAWMWYVKALIYGVKAYRQPKKFMHIAPPDTHWSYELLIRLDFLQAALENAPQVVVQLYALTTQADEDVVLGLLTLILSFVDFIRVAVSVHWDMDKGPVPAPNGCYRTATWKIVNTSSWIFIYAARSSAIALVMATSILATARLRLLFPVLVFTVHILLFGRLLHKAEYGIAAQKIGVTVFISLFFLPELDSTILPQTVQFYYATIIIQNTFFILPWEGFDQEYCITKEGYKEMPRPTIQPELPGPSNGTRALPSTTATLWDDVMPTTTAEPDHGCLIDPTWITLAVPTMTIFGVIFRLVSSQKMFRYKTMFPQGDEERFKTQKQFEASVTKILSRNWTQMTAGEMLQAYLRMLKKEVIIVDKGTSSSSVAVTNKEPATAGKRCSFLTARLQADFLASQTFIRESFSLMTRTTRSHDMNISQLNKLAGSKEDAPPEYNSDSELTFRKNKAKNRPRIPRSRNVSESAEVAETHTYGANNANNTMLVQVDLASGAQFLEMCWI